MSQVENTVKVWDPLVRIFHWSLVASFTLAYLSGEIEGGFHALVGYVLGGLLLARLIWGLVGTRHARFSDFVYGPTKIKQYLSELFKGHPQRYLGHNPAGGAMVVALLIGLVLTTVSGIALYGSEQFAGPLAGWVPSDHAWAEALEEGHELVSNLTLLLVGVHIAGVLVSGRLHGENLVKAMLTGRKPREI